MTELLIPILASVPEGWSTKLFQAARTSAISSSQILVSLALAIACFIIVFKMIKLSYDIMSDEQEAGFGGVRLSQILRPMVILVMIQSCPYIVGAFDKIISSITDNIVASVDTHGKNVKLAELFAVDSATDNMLSAEDVYNAAEAAKLKNQNSYLNNTLNSPELNGQGKSTFNNFYSIVEKAKEKDAVKGGIREEVLKKIGEKDYDENKLNAAVNEYWNAYKKLGDAENNELNGLTVRLSDKNFIPAVCCWLYDRFYLVIQAMAEILLMVLAICAPWMLTFSLIDSFKHVIWVFIGTYIQLSFWKVTAAIINFATLTFRGTTVSFTLERAVQMLNNVIASADGKDIVAPTIPTSAAILLSAVVSIAGVLCLLKVGEITAAIIPSPGNTNVSGAAGGAGTMMSAAGAPVKTVGNVAGKIAGGFKGTKTK